MAVVGPPGVAVVVGAAVVPLGTRVVALTLEGAAVALENLSTRVAVRSAGGSRREEGRKRVAAAGVWPDSPACLGVGGFHSGGFGSEQWVEEAGRSSPAGPGW